MYWLAAYLSVAALPRLCRASKVQFPNHCLTCYNVDCDCSYATSSSRQVSTLPVKRRTQIASARRASVFRVRIVCRIYSKVIKAAMLSTFSAGVLQTAFVRRVLRCCRKLGLVSQRKQRIESKCSAFLRELLELLLGSRFFRRLTSETRE